MGYDHGDSFLLNFEPNGILFGSENREENCHHDHLPFKVKGNGNIVFSVSAYTRTHTHTHTQTHSSHSSFELFLFSRVRLLYRTCNVYLIHSYDVITQVSILVLAVPNVIFSSSKFPFTLLTH